MSLVGPGAILVPAPEDPPEVATEKSYWVILLEVIAITTFAIIIFKISGQLRITAYIAAAAFFLKLYIKGDKKSAYKRRQRKVPNIRSSNIDK